MKKVVIFLIFMLTISFSFSIKISEVYFDGYDEYLGIYNETNKIFSGQIIISGAKSSNFNIDLQIPSKKEIIIGDGDIEKYFSGYKPFTTGLKLSISDTSAINIDILNKSGQILDKFQVPKNLVKKYNNKNTAFEKILYDTGEVIQAVSSGVNNATGYLINPGFVQDFRKNENKNSNSNTGQKIIYQPILCKVGYNLSGNIYNFYFTGNFTPKKISWYLNNQFIDNIDKLSTGINQNSEITAIGYESGFACTGTILVNLKRINNNVFTGSLKIAEIHSKQDILPEYIELQAIGNFSGNIIFSGLGRGVSNWRTHILLFSGNRLIISKNKNGFKSTNPKIYSSMSLLDNGEKLQILSENGKILFETIYPKLSTNQSYYPNLEKIDIPTPGFGLDFLEYYKIQKEQESLPSCKIILQSQQIISNGKLKINFSSKISNSDFCSNNYKQFWIYSGQTIFSGTCNPRSYNFPSGTGTIIFKIQDLSGNTICSDNYNYIFLQNTKTETNTKYIDLTPYNCRNLNSNDLTTLTKLVKQKYTTATLKRIYNPIGYLFTGKLNSRQLRQIVENTMSRYSKNTLKYIFQPTKELFISTNNIKQVSNSTTNTGIQKNYKKTEIVKILPNPVGKDTNEIIVLSGAFSSGLKIFNGTRYYNLSNPIYSGNFIIFKGSLGLKNKANCISLYQNDQLLDTKCYNNVKEGKFIENFLTNLNSNKELIFSGDKIFVNHKVFLNKPLLKKKEKIKRIIKIIKKLFKNYKKQLDKYEKANKILNNLYIKTTIEKVKYYAKYINYKNKYQLLKEKYSKLYKEKTLKNKQYKNNFKNLKNEIRYLKSVISAIKKNIDKEDYQKYLKLYNKVKQGYKIKFSK